MDNLFSLRALRQGLVAGGVALMGALLPVTASAQVPFLDDFAESFSGGQGEEEDYEQEEGLPFIGDLAGQAQQLLGRAATTMPGAAPMMAAPAIAAPVAPALPMAPASPTLDPTALIALANGLNLAGMPALQSGMPTDFSTLPQTFQQQILTVLQQAQQQQAAGAHRFVPGSRAHSRHERAVARRAQARIDSIVARAHRAERRARARAARAS